MALLPTQKLEAGHWQILSAHRRSVAEAILDPRYQHDPEPWQWYMIDDSASGRTTLLSNAVAAVYGVLYHGSGGGGGDTTGDATNTTLSTE